MTLLLGQSALAVRGEIAHSSLRELARSLAADLEIVRDRPIYFPTEKALLSRTGGRCARDGSLLEFDPYELHEHRCPLCGTIYRGELHDRFWIYWYQLWLAERAVQGATLAALGAGDKFAVLATEVLRGYAERYLGYPNVDNVLGPSRLFFSTYLESIWLLQICIAADLLATRDPALMQLTADRVIEPARAIIAEYDEGASNRQVWNDAALFAAARLMGDSAAAEQAVFGESGVASHLGSGLLADGTWYEGENYHLFAHRGLWYGVTMAEHAGMPLPEALVERFQRGFATPFATALPDFTLPSRRDSQYAISLRQWRIAEHCELGFARVADPILLGALRRMYESGEPRRDTGRAHSSADVERNAQSSALTRADLNWRALLFARPTLPDAGTESPESTILDAQGIAVFRRDAGRIYAAVDYGHSGGGHGHPDRLNLILADGETRWLDDFGTGSYVDPSLHWYRSTLAHNAPLVNGHSQLRVHGDLLAYDEQSGAGWISATAEEIAPGASAMRTLVVMPTYVVDVIEWDADESVVFDLPLHADLKIVNGADALTSGTLRGGDGTEDGFAFARDTARQTVRAGATAMAQAVVGHARLTLFAHADGDTEWWRATAAGAPGKGDHVFRVLRSHATRGRYALVWSLRGDVEAVQFDEAIRIGLAGGSTHEHRRANSSWTIETVTDGDRRRIELGGATLPPEVDESLERPHDEMREVRAYNVGRGQVLQFELGEAHYRRSEQSWHDAGSPAAAVAISARDGSLSIDVAVPRSDRTFVPAGTENPFDNEHADINGDGVQLYFVSEAGASGWMLVPEADSDRVRARPIEGWTNERPIHATWTPTAHGYELHARVPLQETVAGIDVVVNEMPSGRMRRRGQLVMTGAAGEFVYLRGDRHERQRLIYLRADA